MSLSCFYHLFCHLFYDIVGLVYEIKIMLRTNNPIACITKCLLKGLKWNAGLFFSLQKKDNTEGKIPIKLRILKVPS